jgi:hypothetical protein
MHEHLIDPTFLEKTSILGFTKPKSIGIGYNCKSQDQHSVAVGYYSVSANDNAVAVGSFTSATHKNSTVLGNNLASKRENSTLLNQAEFTEGGLHLNGGASLISDVKCDEKGLPHRCTACNLAIKYGVKWIKDGYVAENDDGIVHQYADIELGLCFNCILDCVLEFKAKTAWNKDLV